MAKHKVIGDKTKEQDDCYNIGFSRVRGKLKLRFVHRLGKAKVERDGTKYREWKDGSEAKARKLMKELLVG